MENLNITGSADISLFGETRDDLTKNKTFDGGSMTITNRAPFSIDASVYEEDEDAYTNTEGNSERLWEVRPEDEEVYLGTLTYTNDFLEPIDFGETAVGSIIDITLDTPSQGTLRGNGNFFLDIDQQREGAETLEVGFRGLDPNNFEFISTDGETTGVIPYRFDFLGGRPSGSSEDIDPSFTFTVEDDSTVSIDLYGRVFALDNGELPVNDGGDSGSEGSIPIDTDEDSPDTEIEDGGTDSEAEGDTGTDSDVGEEGGDTDTPVDADTDTPDTEGEVEDGIDSDPNETTTDEGADDTTAGDDNPTVDDSLDETPTPDGETDSDVGEGDGTDTPVDTDDSDAEDDGGTDSEPSDTIPGEDNPVTEGESELSIDSISFDHGFPFYSTDALDFEQGQIGQGDPNFDFSSLLTPQSDFKTYDRSITVFGSGIPNQEVDLAVISFGQDSYNGNLTTTVNPNGNWSIEIPETLVDAEYSLIATQFDGSGGLSSDEETLIIDDDYDVDFDLSDPSFQSLNFSQRSTLENRLNNAADLWEGIIQYDIPDVIDENLGNEENNYLFDDVEIVVQIGDQSFSDGEGGTLATTNILASSEGNNITVRRPFENRPEGGFVDELTGQPFKDFDFLPYRANLILDPADLNEFLNTDFGFETLQHEIGHAVGLKSEVFSEKGLLTDEPVVVPDFFFEIFGADYIYGFTGENALAAYKDSGGKEEDGSVPLEPVRDRDGRPGHWNEWLFPDGEGEQFGIFGDPIQHGTADELMTTATPEGSSGAVISTITIGALQDLGFQTVDGAGVELPVYQGSLDNPNPLFEIGFPDT